MHILDTPPEAAYDSIVHMAARLAGAPIALISLVDADRQWFKARVGMEAQETSRTLSFCAHAIQGSGLMEVEDASLDSRFSDNPLVVGQPGIRFYAGMPLTLPSGESVGTLCVIDTVPRHLDSDQRDSLAVLANSVMTEMELRRRVGELEAEVHRRIDAEMRMMHLATRDPLTSLPNRAALIDRLTLALRVAAREKRELAVMFMDLDRFKLINDTLGHDVGDALLQQVAERLSHALRDSDTVARLGGDEFAFILPLNNGAGDARSVADKLIETIQVPMQLNGQLVQVGCSVGMALYPQHGETGESLLRHADLAMYQAKTQGGNCCCEYDAHMDANAVERMTLESELRQAIDEGQLVLYYQPQIALGDGHLVGLEALVRWNHPQRGDSVVGGGAGWLNDGSAVWFGALGSSHKVMQDYAPQLAQAAESSGGDTLSGRCVDVTMFARYPIRRIISLADGKVLPAGIEQDLRGRYRIEFVNGNTLQLHANSEMRLQWPGKASPLLTARLDENEYIARVIDREASAEEREAARALSVVARTYLLQNANRQGECLSIDDSSRTQRVSPNPATAAARNVAAFTSGLVLQGVNVQYRLHTAEKNVLSWRRAVQNAHTGKRFDEILRQEFAQASLASVNGETECNPLPDAERWLRAQARHWRKVLQAEPGFAEPQPKVCQLAFGKPYSDMAHQRIYVRGLHSLNNRLTLAHEYLHLAFSLYPSGQDENYIEQWARRLIEGDTRI